MSGERERRKRPRATVVLAIAATALAMGAVRLPSGASRFSFDPAGPPRFTKDHAISAQRIMPGTSEQCRQALADVEAAGLALRDDTEFRCPADTWALGSQHWGATCWHNRLCPGTSYVAINPAVMGNSEGRLRYTIAHETCHVISYTETSDRGSEEAADQCAAAAGFPRQ